MVDSNQPSPAPQTSPIPSKPPAPASPQPSVVEAEPLGPPFIQVKNRRRSKVAGSQPLRPKGPPKAPVTPATPQGTSPSKDHLIGLNDSYKRSLKRRSGPFHRVHGCDRDCSCPHSRGQRWPIDCVQCGAPVKLIWPCLKCNNAWCSKCASKIQESLAKCKIDDKSTYNPPLDFEV